MLSFWFIAEEIEVEHQNEKGLLDDLDLEVRIDPNQVGIEEVDQEKDVEVVQDLRIVPEETGIVVLTVEIEKGTTEGIYASKFKFEFSNTDF